NRQVDDADVVPILVVIPGHPIERRDDVGDRTVAVAIENLENGQRRTGRDAGVLAARILAVARENAGDVRAVAEIVEPRQARDGRGEILEERDVLEIVVTECQPRVDYRDFDTGARVTEVGAREKRAGRDRRAEVRRVNGTIAVHVRD